ncbi:ATP-binding protein [Candidatus Zixiibacteriota bacterium]
MLLTLLIILAVIFLAALIFWLIGERGRLLRPSTWRMMREGGLGPLLNFRALHGYVYGRWTNQYVRTLIYKIFPRLSPRGKKHLAEHYHGKTLTHEQARAIITLNQDIPLRDLEQIIPYSMARDLVLKGPPDMAAYECCCRHARENPCQPTQVCMVIGQPFVDFVLEHNPQSSRRLTQEEALQMLEAEHQRGHLHSAWFKDAMLDRFYAICNCCKCCCGGIQAMVKHGIPMLASSGYAARVDQDLCRSCGTCQEICPFAAIEAADVAVLDWERCMGCGVCVEKCPAGAISLVRDERKGLPFDVRALVEKEIEN